MKITNAFDGTKAKVGDRVYSIRWGWGTVSCKYSNGPRPIGVVFDECEGDSLWFTKEGGYNGYTTPDLYYGPPEIIGPPKPKRMMQKTVKRWAIVYPLGRYSGLYPTKEEAESNASPGRIACVELTGTYEVEEE